MTKSEITLIRSLADKRARSQTGLFVAEGEKLITELCDSSLRIEKIFAMDGLFEGGNVEVIPPREMERISLLKSPSNSVALVEIPRYTLDAKALRGRLTLVLDEIQNPGNLGTIIRLADWFGIEDIVCSENSADCFNPKVVQATMGAILRVRVHYTDLNPFLLDVAAQNLPIYGTFLEGENIYKTTLPKAGVIVIGNEGHGVSPHIAHNISHHLYIPPYPVDCPSSESLNVAVATGIICSEFRRQM